MPSPAERRRAAEAARRRIAEREAARARRNRVLGGAGVAVLVVAVVAVVATRGGGAGRSTPTGVLSFPQGPPNHVSGSVKYAVTPPVGGDHNPAWQNCGNYDDPVPAEQGVHSLEHGAVWITYRPGLGGADLETVEVFGKQPYTLVSPWSGTDLPAPVVASAWGRQLRLQSADAEALRRFVESYRQSSDAPEPGAPCTSGVGEPV